MPIKNNNLAFLDLMATVELSSIKSGRAEVSLEKLNKSRHYIILQNVRLIYSLSLSENTKHRLSTFIGSTNGLGPTFNGLTMSVVTMWRTVEKKYPVMYSERCFKMIPIKNNNSAFPDLMATVELSAIKSGRAEFSLEKSN